MKAFWDGFADLVAAFFEKARRSGLSIMLLIIMSGGLLYKTQSIEGACEEHMKEMRQQFEYDRQQAAESLNQARRDFLECDLRRQELAIKFAELSIRVQMIEKETKKR
jgi:hypothetical protein